jgi:hypothetical protein
LPKNQTHRKCFGPHPLDPEEIFKKLNDLGESKKKLSSKAVFSVLQSCKPQSAKSRSESPNGLKVAGPKAFFRGHKKNKEFLLDYLWWQKGKGTLLAVESEISDKSRRGMQHDFEKLLYWKSPLKLFIVRPGKKTDANNIKEVLNDYYRSDLRVPLLPGETYLLFVFPPGKKKGSAFIFESTTYAAKLKFRTLKWS